jgi:CDP-glycerol glycerophosphotransferase (TagB/SpsB family)
MKIVLFCEHQYAISILLPLQTETAGTDKHEVLWFVDARNIPDFPLKEEVRWTNNMQEVYDFSPEAIFVPGNIVPYYLPGVKVEIFHGYAAEKKDHWMIRNYLDLYLTQGPYFTKHFQQLALKHKDFEVVETGWTRQDWICENLHAFDEEKQQLLKEHQKQQIVLYAPTFSPSLTSLPVLKTALKQLAIEKEIVLLFKFHPLTRQEWIDEYQQIAAENEHIILVRNPQVTKYILMSDLLISDTSSTVYEALLLDKPVITYKNIAGEKYWLDITSTDRLAEAFEEAGAEEFARKRKWIIDNYDPYMDGKVVRRMLNAVEDYISRHGVPKERKSNLWRKYRSIKKFGKIKRTR